MTRICLPRAEAPAVASEPLGKAAFLDDLLAMAGSLADSRKDYASAQLEDLADSVRQFSESLPALPTSAEASLYL